MSDADRQWLLEHLDGQARYVAALTTYAKDNPSDDGVLLRVRDEVFTLRETLDSLGVPDALSDNERWNGLPGVSHQDRWPSADE